MKLGTASSGLIHLLRGRVMPRHIQLISISVALFLSFLAGTVTSCLAAQKVIAEKVTITPLIDGIGNDRVWKLGREIVTHDSIADIDIALTAIYTNKEIFFRVIFPDPDASMTHKSWTWNKARKIYHVGTDREDTFLFNWKMLPKPADLSISSDDSYSADIWFWKACRTNPVGYADDNIHLLGSQPVKDAVRLASKTGRNVYLLRREDSGSAAYRVNLVTEHVEDVVPRYINQEPSGSRADVEARGVWNNGRWTIEFVRPLKTGNNDDVQFDPRLVYQFGVSRYEIAGRPANPELSQPLYGTGDVGEELTLIFGGQQEGRKP